MAESNSPTVDSSEHVTVIHDSDTNAPVTGGGEHLDFETLLVETGTVTAKQLERARRIAARLEKNMPIGEVLVETGQLTRTEYERLVRQCRARLTLAQILREEGSLSADGAATYAAQRAAGPRRGDRQILVDGGLVQETAFFHALSIKYDIPCVEPEVALIDTKLLEKASLPYLIRNNALPFRVVDGVLHVILADPRDGELIHELEGIFGLPIKPCSATAKQIQTALQTIERLRVSDGDSTSTSLQYREIENVTDEDASGEEAVRLVDYLLFRAIELGASDLHVEPLQSKVRVRVDGVLQNLTELPAVFGARLVARVKVLSGADIAERRLHQDGRIFVKVAGREVDVRVSIYASMFGETLVLRILDRKHGLVPLHRLGFEDRILSMLRDVVLRSSSGLILVTGPTGCGKTTTLYSFIDYINDDTHKVITCEDPVEYVLEGVTQCSINEKTGPTFAASLRAILRQDPDTIVVGEIRDETTSALAVESALTGHKVFSTFHTEDAVGAVVRLTEMGIEPFLVASTLSCVIAQRLVRRLCAACRKPGTASRHDLRFLGLTRKAMNDVPVLDAAGCDACGGSGYTGRLGIPPVPG